MNDDWKVIQRDWGTVADDFNSVIGWRPVMDGRSFESKAAEKVRDAERMYDKGKKILSDDVNSKSNRKWLIVGLASTVALMAVAFGIYLSV